MSYSRRTRLIKTLSKEDIHDVLDQFGSENRKVDILTTTDDIGISLQKNYQKATFYVEKNTLYTLQEEWDHLFHEANFLERLKVCALDGNLGTKNFRSVCWRFFWECISEEESCWLGDVHMAREKYKGIRMKYVIDPYDQEEIDLSTHHPLSLSEDSIWNKYFQDNELRSTITKDLDRLCPEVEFFKQENVKSMILHVLFCYARENPQLSYKQGMHEILGTIVYVMMVSCLAVKDSGDAMSDEVKSIVNMDYIEHDAYALFCNVMETLEPWFGSNPPVKKPANNIHDMPNDRRMFRTHNDSEMTSAISKKLNRLQSYMLKRYDNALHEHLKKIEITPQLYGIRWIRLLFGREFSLNRLLILWDALFADGVSLVLVDYIYLAMLINLRGVLLLNDFSTCLTYLMKYPADTDTKYILKRAIAFKENKPDATYDQSIPQRQKPPPPIHPVRNRLGDTKEQRYANALNPDVLGKQNSQKRTGHLTSKSTENNQSHKNTDVEEQHTVSLHNNHARSEFTESKQHLSDRNTKGTVVSQISNLKTKVGSPTQIINRISKSMPKSKGTEVVNALVEDHVRLQQQVTSLKSDIDKLHALCTYCGGKMDIYLSLLQDRLLKSEEFSDEVAILSIAGLKQVRDIFRNKLECRGSTLDYDVDFADIDRHIGTASSNQQAVASDTQKADVLPEQLPVAYLADFSHFKSNEGDQNILPNQQHEGDSENGQKCDEEKSIDSLVEEKSIENIPRVISALASGDVDSPTKQRKFGMENNDVSSFDELNNVMGGNEECVENLSFHESNNDPLSAFLLNTE